MSAAVRPTAEREREREREQRPRLSSRVRAGLAVLDRFLAAHLCESLWTSMHVAALPAAEREDLERAVAYVQRLAAWAKGR